MQKQVKIINIVAEKFGIFKAVELDLEKFKTGIIAIKGEAGQGKSTFQNAIKLASLGRSTLADANQYGNEFSLELQLSDNRRRIFIGAKNNKGTISYKLYEKDESGKKIYNPVIDGEKATPSAYMEIISTELTFGIRKFLSEDYTTHKKFMFELFRPELKEKGVIFDKKDTGYEESILGRLDEATVYRDNLRAQCTHRGAFATDFERDGLKLEAIAAMDKIDISALEDKKNELLVSKGKQEGDAKAEYEKKKSEISSRGQALVNECRSINEKLLSDYENENKKYNKILEDSVLEKSIVENISKDLVNLCCVQKSDQDKLFGLKRNCESFIRGLKEAHSSFFVIPEKPVVPTTILIENNKIRMEVVKYPSCYEKVIKGYKELALEFSNLQEPDFSTSDLDKEILELELKTAKAKVNNEYVERYTINRNWVAAAADVNKKRDELAKLYADVDTGVEGLKMKPFFNEDGKMEIKTVYNGCYDPEFFKNDGLEDRLLVSYSSTQRPLIGVLLQVARLKKKEKVFPYVFLDDVPMDVRSRNLITRIAEENDLSIMTSITGDFSKDKLTENELLIEGGEVFFHE